MGIYQVMFFSEESTLGGGIESGHFIFIVSLFLKAKQLG